MPPSHLTSLHTLLNPSRKVQIVDIGANPIDGDPPYKALLAANLAELVGFEPQPEALAELESKKRPNERYLPYAVGNGKKQALKVCKAPGLTSLLEPDQTVLEHFQVLSALSEVVETTPLATTRLDDIKEIKQIDFLKIDIQGSELSVFQHGRSKLAEAVAIQTEVSFIPIYKNQPVFGEVDTELRKQGFIPHCLKAVKRWIIAPTIINNNPRLPLNQLLEADIVYVKDFMYPAKLSDEQLKMLALIADGVYQSYDLTNRCISLLEQRGVLPEGTQNQYLRTLS